MLSTLFEQSAVSLALTTHNISARHTSDLKCQTEPHLVTTNEMLVIIGSTELTTTMFLVKHCSVQRKSVSRIIDENVLLAYSDEY